MGKGGKAQTIGYKYYLGMHLGICHGPIDNISRLSVDDRIAWSGENTGGSVTVNAADLFGGEKREGGVSGTIDIEMGAPTQGQNSYLVSMLGSLIPAFRGVVGLVFRQCYLGNNPYLKKWSARGQRIHVRQNGVAQWYDDTAEIIGLASTSPIATYSVNLNAVTNGATNGTGGLANGVTLSGLAADQVLVMTPNLAGPNVAWSPWGSPSPVGGMSGSVYRWNIVRGGNPADVVDRGKSGTYNGYAAARTAYMDAYPNGQQVRGSSSYTFYIEDSPVNDNSGGLSLTVDVYPGSTIDMNPAHIVRECLTDPDWGMGYTDADVDEDSFVAAADTFYAEGLGLSLLWDKQTKIDDFVQTVLQHVDAALYVSRSTGKFVLKPIRGDYDEGSLLSLDESNIVTVDDPTRVAFGELTNSVTVTYWDAQTGKDGSITVTDTALVQQQGVVINSPLQYPGFSNPRNATIAAQRDLRVLSSPLLSCTITADSDAKVLNIGDVFKFSWAKWGLVDVVMRVNGISYGTGRNNRVKINCTQDVFDTDTTVQIVVPGTGWTDPSAPPSAITDQLAVEAPYFELVQGLGQADTDNKLLTHPEIGYVIGACSRPASAINANMHTDSGEGYEDVGTLDFAPVGFLVADITKLETNFFIENYKDLSEVTLGTHVQINDELMRVDALDVDTGSMTVGRGVLDTVPAEHAAGDMVLFWDAYAGFDPTEYVESELVDVKIVPVSGQGVLTLAEATPMTVEIVGRAARPYAPGDLRVNGLSYSAGPFADELTVSWTHRDRLQQTAGTLVDHTAANIGPEAGTVYKLEGYVDNVLLHTEDDIAGTSTTWTPLTGGTVRVQVHAKRDGLLSFQGPSHEFEYGELPVDPYWDNVVFYLTGQGVDGSTVFTDLSQYNRVMTAVGAVQNDTDISVGSIPSIKFDADANYLHGAWDDSINITGATGPDFCMEAYVYCTDVSQNNQIFGRRRNSNNYILAIVANQIVFSTFSGTTGTTRLQVNADMSNNTVYHVAVIRVGTTYYGFVNGVLKGSNTQASSAGIDGTNLYIGQSENDQAARFWRGNLNWMRITMGAARYDVAGFTPPTLPLPTARPDPVATPSATFANVVLLLGFNGADAATTTADESSYARAMTFVGNAQLDDAHAKFGTTSLKLDGTGDYLTTPDAAELRIPTGTTATDDFCMEAWIYMDTIKAGRQAILNKRPSTSGQEFSLDLSDGMLSFLALSGGNDVVSLTDNEVLATGQWHHVALSGEGVFYRMFVNGVLKRVATRRAAPTTNTQVLRIGRDGFSTARDFQGWIDEVRYTKNEPVYTQTFIPPATAFPRS